MGAGQGIVIAAWWGPALLCAMLLGVAGCAVCLLLGRSWPPSRRRMIGIPSLFLIALPLASLLFVSNKSMTLVVYQEATLAIAAGATAAYSIWFLWRGVKKPGGSEFSAGGLIAGAVIAFIIGYWALLEATEFYGDVIRPRGTVHGWIEALFPSHWTSQGTEAAKIKVDGQWLYATTDIEPRLQCGTLIEAEVGAGSGYILSLKEP